MQASFSTTLYEHRLYRVVPELFFSSYGRSYQLQLGGNLHYSLGNTNIRQGELILGSRYNLSKSVIFLLQYEQPAYVVGVSTDLYTAPESPFSHAFELSMAIRQAVVGNSARQWRWKPNWNLNWKWNKNRKAKLNASRRKKSGKGKTGYEKRERYVKERPKLPGVDRLPYLLPEESEFVYMPEEKLIKNIKRRKGEISLTALGKAVHFQTASARLTDQGLLALKDIAELLLKNPHYRIRIVGHTDDLGGPDFNKKLSVERAEVEKKALLAHGVEESQVEIEGAGMSRPLVPNTSDMNRRLNRRVEFMLFEN
jgi:outer membrane protein OmpA-like peptidoglycan-associated protein